MRIFTAIILAATLLFSMPFPSYAASHPGSAITPFYLEAQSANIDLTITSSGFALINIKVQGDSTLQTISAIVHLERNVYGMWVRVDIGKPNNEWTGTYTGNTLNKSFTTNLTSSGQYRAVAILTLTGNSVEQITITDFTTF